MPGKVSRKAIPVTCFTGFLGAGKTTTILGLLKQLPKDYKVVLVKNEYGDVEVDSLLASQANITGVSEILNGCLCCTMVGLVENALIEIRDKFAPDRIIIESSGSAFPATLALQIRQLEPEGFKLDGVVTVIDCLNFRGYEDTSPSAKLQARYTDLLLLNKHQLLTEHELDILQDHLGELNDETPRLKIGSGAGSDGGEAVAPEVVFGLDTRLWGLEEQEREGKSWAAVAGEREKGWHGDEVEVKTVWRGGSRPGEAARRKRKRITQSGTEASGSMLSNGHSCSEDEAGCGHSHHAPGDECAGSVMTVRTIAPPGADAARGNGEVEGGEDIESVTDHVEPIERDKLEAELAKLSFEIYRVKGILRLRPPPSSGQWEAPFSTSILNYAFGRYELTPFPSLDADADLEGVGLRLTFMGERGEVARQARKFAEALGAEMA